MFAGSDEISNKSDQIFEKKEELNHLMEKKWIIEKYWIWTGTPLRRHHRDKINNKQFFIKNHWKWTGYYHPRKTIYWIYHYYQTTTQWDSLYPLNRLVSTEKLKCKNSNLRQKLKTQRFIHQQQQNKTSNTNKSSHTGSTINWATIISRPYWPRDKWPLLLSTWSNLHKLLCPDNFHGPNHRQKYFAKYIQKRKPKFIIRFAANARVKRHHFCKNTFNRIHEKHL